MQELQTEPVQTESPNAPVSAVLKAIPLWQWGVLAGLCIWLYWSTVSHLVGQWWTDENFSHGFFVPLFSAFVIWQERDRLARLIPRPSWPGLAVLVAGVGVAILGRLGAELFLDRSSMLLVLAGVVILFLGWNLFRAVLFPWACLLLMIPIPVIIFNQIAFPLQLLVSKIAAATLPLLDVPVLRLGNVLKLPLTDLEVARACSGMRSLMSLLTLAIIYGYLMEKRLWVRWLLALASVPVAIAANSVRIIGTGLLVEHGFPDAAEGSSHAAWGVIVFVISLLMLYALHALIRVWFPEEGGEPLRSARTDPRLVSREGRQGVAKSLSPFIAAALLLAGAAIFLRERSEVFPARLEFKQFPAQLGDWTGTDETIRPDVLEILKPSDHLLRIYRNPQATQYIDLLITFYRSQRAGEAPHSPQNCLPGSGWTPIDNQRVTITVPGHEPFPANRYIIAMGDSRQIVLYWYWAHNRGVASEYWAKYYLVKDSIKMHRSDGSLVRIMSPMDPGETADAAQQRLLPFVREVVPLLSSYIPR